MDHTNNYPLNQEIDKAPSDVKVGMWEFDHTTEQSPVISTHGLGPCIGVATWDPTTKIAHMSHVPVAFMAGKFNEAFWNSVKEHSDDTTQLKVWVRGGQSKASDASDLDWSQINRDSTLEAAINAGVPAENLNVIWDETPMGTMQGTTMHLDSRTGAFESKVYEVTNQQITAIGNTAVQGI